MAVRWSRRLASVAAGVAVCLVPLLGSLAHSHDHHEAQESHAHGIPPARGQTTPTLAASHDGDDHLHLPSADATLSRLGHDWVEAPLAGPPSVASIRLTPWLPLAGPDDPRPQRTHDPPAAPRAPPFA
jgi:hypothetical protein